MFEKLYPKLFGQNDYLQELWEEKGKYLKAIRESQNEYGFDDIVSGAAHA